MTPFEELEGRRRLAGSSYIDIKKHYVRMHGWLPVFTRYSELRRTKVKYLTLCAKRAIDVRYFRQKDVLVHDDGDKKYPTVAFIEKESQDFATIAETLGTTLLGIKRGLEEVILSPTTFPDDHKALLATFPYDVVNLDFTGDVVPQRDHPYSSTLRAIERIITLQHEKGSREWHLFLTFRACRATSNEDANSQISAKVQDNLADPGLKAAYGSRPAPPQMLNSNYTEFLRIGIPKYLAWRASDSGYSFNLDGSYYYRREPPSGDPYDIIKFVIGFKSLWQANQLPDRRAATANYRRSVEGIFSSSGIDVFAKLNDRIERVRVQRDLDPIIEELKLDGLSN